MSRSRQQPQGLPQSVNPGRRGNPVRAGRQAGGRAGWQAGGLRIKVQQALILPPYVFFFLLLPGEFCLISLVE